MTRRSTALGNRPHIVVAAADTRSRRKRSERPSARGIVVGSIERLSSARTSNFPPPVIALAHPGLARRRPTSATSHGESFPAPASRLLGALLFLLRLGFAADLAADFGRGSLTTVSLGWLRLAGAGTEAVGPPGRVRRPAAARAAGAAATAGFDVVAQLARGEQ